MTVDELWWLMGPRSWDVLSNSTASAPTKPSWNRNVLVLWTQRILGLRPQEYSNSYLPVSVQAKISVGPAWCFQTPNRTGQTGWSRSITTEQCACMMMQKARFDYVHHWKSGWCWIITNPSGLAHSRAADCHLGSENLSEAHLTSVWPPSRYQHGWNGSSVSAGLEDVVLLTGCWVAAGPPPM